MKKQLTMPNPRAVPAARAAMPKKPGAADLDATMVGRANKVVKGASARQNKAKGK